jgi:hypothetical protein
MSFYECREFIVEQIVQYFHDAVWAKGLNTSELVKQYNELQQSFNDVYSRSLLKKGTPREEAPTFANVPYNGVHTWSVQDHLSEIFAILDIPDTQAALHGFWLKLKRRGIENVLTLRQKEDLVDWNVFTNQVKKLSDWTVRARSLLTAMHANLPLLQSVTEEEKEFANSLQSFDWWYDYSDQASTRRHGEARHIEVGKKVKETLAEKPQLRKVIETVAAAHNLGPGFFTYTGK